MVIALAVAHSLRCRSARSLCVQREVGLLSSLSLTVGRQIVGLSSGYIRAYSRTRNRKQVIVLVNEGQS